MKIRCFQIVFILLFIQNIKAQDLQDLFKLSSEILSASIDLNNSLNDLHQMKIAISDIESGKTPNISNNEWSDLAYKYRKAAQEIEKVPLPTTFNEKQFAVTLEELQNCKSKNENLSKMNAYLIELKAAQERGRQSIIKNNEISKDIKVSRELLRYCIDIHEKLGVETEKAAAWMSILDDPRSRGVKDIFFLCSDNLSGLDKAVEAIFPDSIRQICIVHQIRNSLKYVSYKDRKAIMVDIKAIYQADNEKFALEAFELFKQNWEDKYLSAVQSWENNWDNLTTFLNYPKEIRKLIYTTNIIESFNASLRKYTRNKKVFPHDDAALKSIYLAAQSISKKWKRTRFKWEQIYNQLYICFPNRL